jgi:hypothetical protein
VIQTLKMNSSQVGWCRQRYRFVMRRAGARSCGDAREMLEPWTRGLARIQMARRAKEVHLPLLPLLLLHRNRPPRM